MQDEDILKQQVAIHIQLDIRREIPASESGGLVRRRLLGSQQTSREVRPSTVRGRDSIAASGFDGLWTSVGNPSLRIISGLPVNLEPSRFRPIRMRKFQKSSLVTNAQWSSAPGAESREYTFCREKLCLILDTFASGTLPLMKTMTATENSALCLRPHGGR